MYISPNKSTLDTQPVWLHIFRMRTTPHTKHNPAEKIALIACGVLALDCKELAAAATHSIQMHFLPGGLHQSPPLLRQKLQEAIDQIDRENEAHRIVIGYGLCGHGTTGIQARTLPLVIPRVHDCIALFLGSDEAYRKQFAQAPGTYYLSAGWVEEKNHPESGMGSGGPSASTGPVTQDLTTSYGADNAAYIENFLQSWTRNYTRSAFIDTGVGGSKEHYANQAQQLAREHGWQYERIKGTHTLLQAALSCTATTESMLFVPPGGTTIYDPLRGRLTCSEPGHKPPAPQPLDQPSSDAQTHAADRRGLGIGIDAGGTYTDAVLYDFETQTVINKNKALTTHWDYSHGIQEALSGLDQVLCRKAVLVAVSTTIATNAIVEHRGQAVGLLVMPPCGWSTLDGFRHEPVATIQGQMGIDGTERAPINLQEIAHTAKQLVQKNGVTAFAVGGYAAHINPAHELQVKQIVEKATGLICTCSHELSNSLHYRIRAETAALNARIIPCLEDLLQRISCALATFNIHAPVMVVRSDGSFMNLRAACERPLETMLSGPAASAAGAGWLAQRQNALIVDIGGTTTDTAILADGRVAMNPEGASIGGWQTHIRALDLQTAGLGGDSCIRMKKGRIVIGPDRVIPLAWSALHVPGTKKTLERCTSEVVTQASQPNDWIFLIRTRKQCPDGLSPREKAVLDTLEDAPLTAGDLARAVGVVHPALLPLKSLLQQQLVAYTGFTPTDALHVTGKLKTWDAVAPRTIAACCATSPKHAKAWAQNIIHHFQIQLAREIARKALNIALPDIDTTAPQIDTLLTHLVTPADAQPLAPSLRLALPWPVIGIGAPAAAFTPAACLRLHANAIIPPHADVANAVGAIIGTISVQHTLHIASDENGVLRISGAADAPKFTQIEDATQWCITFLHQHLTDRARQAGCPQPCIAIKPQDRLAPANDGSPVFIGRDIYGRAHGLPAT